MISRSVFPKLVDICESSEDLVKNARSNSAGLRVCISNTSPDDPDVGSPGMRL